MAAPGVRLVPGCRVEETPFLAAARRLIPSAASSLMGYWAPELGVHVVGVWRCRATGRVSEVFSYHSPAELTSDHMARVRFFTSPARRAANRRWACQQEELRRARLREQADRDGARLDRREHLRRRYGGIMRSDDPAWIFV